MNNAWESLRAGARTWGVLLTDAMVASFRRYYDELLTWNTRMNLTRITAQQEVIDKHFLDALACAQSGLFGAGRNLELVDLASGPGFPGIPLQIAYPEMSVTLIESTSKKAAFLQHLVAHLGLRRTAVVPGRAEALGHDRTWRERFDLGAARALGHMAVVAEVGLPLLRPDGHLIAMKGPRGAEELPQALSLIQRLGGVVEDTVQFRLPLSGADRLLVILRKVHTTPGRYPRPWNRITGAHGHESKR